MRIAFINPSLRPESARRQLPVGLAYVLTAVKNAGIEFDLIDMDIESMSMDELESRLAARPYDVYAVGCIVTGFRLVRSIAQIAKASNPQALVIAGNSVADSIPELLLRSTEVDIAVIGESDVTIVELLRAIEAGTDLAKVAGLHLRDGDNIVITPKRELVENIDNLGFPHWALFDLDKYNSYAHVANIFSDRSLSYPLNAARGCPHNCTFCYHVFKGQRYRKYSEDVVMSEIRRLHDEFGCDFISFWDELTFPTIKSVERMVEELEALPFVVGWEATSRADLFRAEHVDLIRRMKACGCENIAFSLENASPEILRAMNKKIEVDQFVEQSLALWEGGVVPLTSIIFGYPQETAQTIKDTIDVCRRCRVYPSTGFLLPLPGTSIYDWAVDKGIIGDEVAYLERIGDRQDFHINLTQMSDEELVGTVERELRKLAQDLGLELESVFKTGTYRKPADEEDSVVG